MVSREQLECGDVLRADHAEVPAAQRGERRDPEAFAEGHQGGIGAAETQVGIRGYQLADADPVTVLDVLHPQGAVGDRGEHRCFGSRRPLTVEQTSGFRDHHGCGHKGAGMLLQDGLACLMVSIAGVSSGNQRAGVDQQHSVAPEALGEQLVGLGGAVGLAGRPDGHEGQMSAPPRRGLLPEAGHRVILPGEAAAGWDGDDAGRQCRNRHRTRPAKLIRLPHALALG